MFECLACTYPQPQTFNSPLAILGLWPQLSFLCFLHILAGELRFFLKNKRSFLLFGNQSVFLRALAYDVRYTAGMELLPTHSQTSPQGELIWVQSKINNTSHIVLGSPTIHLPLPFETNTSRQRGSGYPSSFCYVCALICKIRMALSIQGCCRSWGTDHFYSLLAHGPGFVEHMQEGVFAHHFPQDLGKVGTQEITHRRCCFFL